MSTPIDITGITRAGLNKLWAKAALILTSVTLKIGPVDTYDPDTDATTTAWTTTLSIDAITWNEKLTEKEGSRQSGTGNAPAIGNVKKALFRFTDLADAVPDIRSIVVIAGVEWEVRQVESPPAEVLYILTLSKKT